MEDLIHNFLKKNQGKNKDGLKFIIAPKQRKAVFRNMNQRTNCYPGVETEEKSTAGLQCEFVVKEHVFPCLFSCNGCQEELTLGEAEKHKDSCKFRFLPEKSSTIWLGGNSEFASHMCKDRTDVPCQSDDATYNNELFYTMIKDDSISVLLCSDDNKTALFSQFNEGVTVFKKVKLQCNISDDRVALGTQNSELINIDMSVRLS